MQRMILHRTGALVLACTFVLAAAAPVFSFIGEKTKKKRIAVFTFKNKTDKQWRWWGSKSVGDGMADMLITELVRTGNYIVLERTELDQLMKEQELGQSGAVTAESAAEVGKLLGVEIAVMGAVTEFGQSRGGTKGSLKGVSVGVKSDGATAAVDVRLVNTATGEILVAESVRKTEKKRGLSFRKGRTSFAKQSDFDKSLIGKATRKAINDVVKLIDDKTEAVPWQGKVVLARGGKVIINAGEEGGVAQGEKFVVVRPGEALIDPDTGLNLGTMESEVGVIEVTNNTMGNGKASECRIVSGSGFQRGDIVREK